MIQLGRLVRAPATTKRFIQSHQSDLDARAGGDKLSLLSKQIASDPYVLVVVFGLSLTFFLGGLLGGYISSQTSHWVHAAATDANGLWLFHWARDGGDLRVAHFFGIHAMQVLPLMASPLIGKRNWSARAIVVAISCAYVALTLNTFLQAIEGKPFIG